LIKFLQTSTTLYFYPYLNHIKIKKVIHFLSYSLSLNIYAMFYLVFFLILHVFLCPLHSRTSLVGNMHVVINPELVMEVEARMNRAYLPSRLLPTHLRGSTLPHHRKSSLYHTSTGNLCIFVNLIFFCFMQSQGIVYYCFNYNI